MTEYKTRVSTKKLRQVGKLVQLRLRWRGSNTFSLTTGLTRWDWGHATRKN